VLKKLVTAKKGWGFDVEIAWPHRK
jgi:hypothetical protein